MTPDPAPGFPGWFIALFIVLALLSVVGVVWRISAARSLAKQAGLDPNKAAAITMLSEDGLSAAYLASTLAPRSAHRTVHPSEAPKSVEERLKELRALRDNGLVSDAEYEAQRQRILDSV